MPAPTNPPVFDRHAAPNAASDHLRNLTVRRLLILIVALGLAWRIVVYALGMPIWGDEAFLAINFVVRDFRGLIDPLVYGQIAPLAFVWAELAISKSLGWSEWALRLLPFLAGIACLLLFARFCVQVLPRRAALLSIGIFAASYYVVRHGAEVKPYSTDALIALVLTMLAWRVLEGPRLPLRWAALILAAGLAVWCSYPSMFVGGGIGLVLTYLLWRERFDARILAGWAALGLVLCASSLAMYLTYAKPHAEQASALTELESWSATFPPLDEPWKLPKWFFHVHTGPMFSYPQGGKAPWSFATFVLFVIGAIRLWRTRRELAMLLLSPLLLTFVAASMKAYPYGGAARVALFMAPGICLLAGLGLYAILQRFCKAEALPKAVTIATCVLALLPIGGIVDACIQPYKSETAFRGNKAVRDVAARTGPNDVWVLFNADRQVPYAPYLGDWRGVGGQFVFDVLRFAPVAVQWSPAPESVEAKPGGAVWLLAFNPQRAKVRLDVSVLDQYAATLTKRLGEPGHETVLVSDDPEKQRRETIEVYVWKGRRDEGT